MGERRKASGPGGALVPPAPSASERGGGGGGGGGGASSGMAAPARARLSDPSRGIRGSRQGDFATSARAQGRSLRVRGRSSLCTPRADHARGRRAQVRSSAGPGMEWPSGAGHDPRRRIGAVRAGKARDQGIDRFAPREKMGVPPPRVYRSLSQVAKAITGTNWNGHRFFGLKAVRTGASNRKRNVTPRPNSLLDIGVSPALAGFAPAMPDRSPPLATKESDSASPNGSAWRPSCEGAPKASPIGSHKDPCSNPSKLPRQARAAEERRSL